MSPRAACRLERLGFKEVYDYVAGIADWKAAGLPTEGAATPVQRVADATRPDIPTCGPDDTIANARSNTFDAGWDECVVIDCDGIVIGRLRGNAWETDDTTSGQIMESDPTTVRPDGPLQPLVDRMAKRDTTLVLVTTPKEASSEPSYAEKQNDSSAENHLNRSGVTATDAPGDGRSRDETRLNHLPLFRDFECCQGDFNFSG